MLQGTMAWLAAGFVLIIIVFLFIWLKRLLGGAVSQKEVAKSFLEQCFESGDLTTPDEQGRTPLMLAAVEGDIEVVETILEAEQDVDLATAAGATALHYAAAFGHIDAARAILKKGADKNPVDIQGRTPLWAAAQQGHGNVVKLLAGRGADINHPDSIGGITPLMTAAAAGQTKVVPTLLDLGADPNLKAGSGQTALDFAREAIGRKDTGVKDGKRLRVMVKVLESKTD